MRKLILKYQFTHFEDRKEEKQLTKIPLLGMKTKLFSPLSDDH